MRAIKKKLRRARPHLQTPWMSCRFEPFHDCFVADAKIPFVERLGNRNCSRGVVHLMKTAKCQGHILKLCFGSLKGNDGSAICSCRGNGADGCPGDSI